MKKLLLAMSLVFLGVATAHSQAPYKIRTNPKLPMREALDRMNLVLAWNTRVQVDGNRDGVFSVQLIPGSPNQLVVQTYKGAVYLYDADNGDLVWKTQIGVPYWTPMPAAFNSQSIFVTRRSTLHVVNRYNGFQRVYTYDERTMQADFGFELTYTPNAAPVADEDFIYFSMGDRLNAYFIPDFERIANLKRSRDRAIKDAKDAKPLVAGDDYARETADSPQPVFLWGYRFGDQFMTTSPLVFGEQLSMLTTDGTLTGVGRDGTGPRENYYKPFSVFGRTPGAAGQHWNMAYVASTDFNLYAINMNNGALKWRYVSGAPILRGPDVNDRDIYLYPDGIGLRRVDRITGKEIWTNRDTQRFLAANQAFVYALDHVGKFFVVDARRGTTLAKLDLSDWAIAIANEWTDRVYLAANDGQIMCLRHRDLVKPLIMKTPEPPRPKEEKKEPKKKEEEKKEDKKDDKEKAAVPPAPLPTLPRALAVTARNLESPREIELALAERRTWAGL
jgi:outer membrane protein assembly factor BamB